MKGRLLTETEAERFRVYCRQKATGLALKKNELGCFDDERDEKLFTCYSFAGGLIDKLPDGYPEELVFRPYDAMPINELGNYSFDIRLDEAFLTSSPRNIKKGYLFRL